MIKHLNTVFSLKDLGQVHYFLNIEVIQTKDRMHFCQGKYIRDLLQKANMVEAKTIPTPMITPQFFKDQGIPTVDGLLYRNIVGALQYVTITKPDIAYSVNKVCQYMQCSLDSH